MSAEVRPGVPLENAATTTEPARSDETTPLRVALLGCGVVGSSVARLLLSNGSDLGARFGRPLALVGIGVEPAVGVESAVGGAGAARAEPDAALGLPAAHPGQRRRGDRAAVVAEPAGLRSWATELQRSGLAGSRMGGTQAGRSRPR